MLIYFYSCSINLIIIYVLLCFYFLSVSMFIMFITQSRRELNVISQWANIVISQWPQTVNTQWPHRDITHHSDLTVISQWPCEIIVRSLWCHYEITVILLWDHGDVTVIILWDHCDVTVRYEITVRSLCVDKMRSPWEKCEITVISYSWLGCFQFIIFI